jgi:hypothetical protein
MTHRFILVLAGLLISVAAGKAALQMRATADEAHWPQWRGPFNTGVARGSAPTEFGDSKNVKWKAEVPGRGHSTPVIWGDRLFLTTAVPVAGPAAAAGAGACRQESCGW